MLRGNVTQIIKSSKGVVASVTVTVTAAATSTLAFLSLAFLTATALATIAVIVPAIPAAMIAVIAGPPLARRRPRAAAANRLWWLGS